MSASKRYANAMIRPDNPDQLETLTVRLTEMFSDEALARRWLHTPRVGFGGETDARRLIRTKAGTLEVEALLTRVNHGVSY